MTDSSGAPPPSGTDKSFVDAASAVDADATIHNCHRAKSHVGDHQCACGKKIAAPK